MDHSEEITPEMLHQLQTKENNQHYKIQGSRIIFTKNCEYCYEAFFPKRCDQKYCSGSCRVRACNKRKGYTHQKENYQKLVPTASPALGSLMPQDPNPKPEEQKFSWQHVGESALGAAAVTGVNYLTVDRPMMQKMDRALQLLEAKQLSYTPLSTSPLHFLRLHKFKKNIIAMFRNPSNKEIVGCDAKGTWIKQVSANPEKWVVIKK